MRNFIIGFAAGGILILFVRLTTPVPPSGSVILTPISALDPGDLIISFQDGSGEMECGIEILEDGGQRVIGEKPARCEEWKAK